METSMKKYRRTGSLFLVFTLVVATTYGQTEAARNTRPARPANNRPVTLKVGDPAPPLNPTWLKGQASGKFGDGKVHVVEFWATWCGPCRMNMPHLSKLAQQYRDEVPVIAISIWEKKAKTTDYKKKVKTFVDFAHDMMDYVVGVDDTAETIGNSWVRASGRSGIPTVFVIDQEGKIAWIGLPFAGLDVVVPLVIARKFDETARLKVTKDYQESHARFTVFKNESKDALKAGDYVKALASAEAAMKVAPVFDDYVIPLKYEALDKMDRKKGRAYAQEILKSHKNAPVLLISMMAKAILAEDYKNADYELALQLIEAGMRYVDIKEGWQVDLLAQALFKTGNIGKGLEMQELALNNMNAIPEFPQDMKDKARQRLDTYKNQKNSSN